MIKLVTTGESSGVDGIEPIATELANTWAQIAYIDQSRAFEFGKASFRTGYEFIIRYDTALDGLFTVDTAIEYNNRRFTLSTLQRIDRLENTSKFRSSFIVNENGRYWRAVAVTEDIA